MCIMRSFTYFRSCGYVRKYTMTELQVQEIVTLWTPQTYRKRSRLKVSLCQKSGAYGISCSALSAF